MHLKDEISSLSNKNDIITHFIPDGLTGVMHPSDVRVNKFGLRIKIVD